MGLLATSCLAKAVNREEGLNQVYLLPAFLCPSSPGDSESHSRTPATCCFLTVGPKQVTNISKHQFFFLPLRWEL